MKLSIILAVFNEAATVETLLARVWEQPLSIPRELVIIESNSSDGTREHVKRFASDKARTHPGEIQLILQNGPRGKGHAVREGLGAATGDIILIQDGDLEYEVTDYPALLEPILGGRAAFVLGSRHLAGGDWQVREFEKNRVLSLALNLGAVAFHSLFNAVYDQKLTDPTTMYKVFRRDCIEGLTLSSNRFDFDFELVAKLIRRGYIPVEVPVSYRSRGFDAGKKVRPFRDPLTWLWAIVKFRFTTCEPAVVSSRRSACSE